MQIKHSKPYIDNQDIKAIAEQTKSGNHATQQTTIQFQNQLAKLINQKYAKATSSGTTALHLSLLALNIKQGDEVIIPSYVCSDVLNAVYHSKTTPILADIEENSFNISAKTIQPLITERTKAIILPHLFGIPADIEPIIEIAKKHNIPIIEDCAQSLGAKYKDNTFTGSKATISIFSFYATKMISTGQGGMILTSSDEIKSKLDDLMTYDKKPVYTIGYNFNMTDIQAALGLSQLKKLDKFITRRKEISKKYNQAFKNLEINLTNYPNGSYAYRYIIRLKDKESRDRLNEKLNEKGIHSGDKPVFKPLHQYLHLPSLNFPNSEQAYNTVLSIPIYPALTDEEVDYIIDTLKDFFN